MIKITNDRTDRTQILHYHFDGNEWYQKWEDKFDLTRVLIEERRQKLEKVHQQVLDGELSPIAFHAQKNMFQINTLSAYTGIPKRQIKKHFKPENFNQIDGKTLEKYAAVFKISINEFNNIQI